MCSACGETISLQQLSKDGLITKTLDVLPAEAREAFIAAQTSSCRHKDRRTKDTIRQHNNDEAAMVRFAKGLLECIIARMVVCLSVLWDLRENGKTLSAEIAQDLHRREFSYREKILRENGWLRPYQEESTTSRLISEVKSLWAQSVPALETTWEHWVLQSLFVPLFCVCLWCCIAPLGVLAHNTTPKAWLGKGITATPQQVSSCTACSVVRPRPVPTSARG